MKNLASHLFLAGSFVSLRSLLKCHLLREGIGDHSGYCLLPTLYSPLLFLPFILNYLAFLFSVCLEKVTFNDFGARGKCLHLRRPEKVPWPRTQKILQCCFFLFISNCTGLISLLTKHTCCEYLDMSVSLSPTTHLITTQFPLLNSVLSLLSLHCLTYHITQLCLLHGFTSCQDFFPIGRKHKDNEEHNP